MDESHRSSGQLNYCLSHCQLMFLFGLETIHWEMLRGIGQTLVVIEQTHLNEKYYPKIVRCSNDKGQSEAVLRLTFRSITAQTKFEYWIIIPTKCINAYKEMSTCIHLSCAYRYPLLIVDSSDCCVCCWLERLLSKSHSWESDGWDSNY